MTQDSYTASTPTNALPKHAWAWWIIPIAYVVATNACLIVPLFILPGISEANPDASGALTSGIFLLLSGCWVASLAQCIVMHVRRVPQRREFSRRAMLLMKLGLLPFFCMGGVLILLLALVSFHPILIMIGVMGIPLMLVTGWFAMLAGSVWAIAYAEGLHQDRTISTAECVIHTIAQLFFFLDAIDAIVLFVRGKKNQQG